MLLCYNAARLGSLHARSHSASSQLDIKITTAQPTFPRLVLALAEDRKAQASAVVIGLSLRQLNWSWIVHSDSAALPLRALLPAEVAKSSKLSSQSRILTFDSNRGRRKIAPGSRSGDILAFLCIAGSSSFLKHVHRARESPLTRGRVMCCFAAMQLNRDSRGSFFPRSHSVCN